MIEKAAAPPTWEEQLQAARKACARRALVLGDAGEAGPESWEVDPRGGVMTAADDDGVTRWQGRGWYVAARPGRTIDLSKDGATPMVGVWDGASARALAIALLQAADIAEQPAPVEIHD